MRTRFVIFTLTLLAACAPKVDGVTFDSETALLEALGTNAVLGRFDLQWPATVLSVDRPRGAELRFEHAGKQQLYPGVDVAKARLVRVRHIDQDGLLVVLDHTAP